MGCYEISLNVWEGNDEAMTFYVNMGIRSAFFISTLPIKPMCILKLPSDHGENPQLRREFKYTLNIR